MLGGKIVRSGVQVLPEANSPLTVRGELHAILSVQLYGSVWLKYFCQLRYLGVGFSEN